MVRITHAQAAMTDLSHDTHQALLDHRRSLGNVSLETLFAEHPDRFARLSLQWDDWLADWSKQWLTPRTMALLVDRARACNLESWIAALFVGEKVNLSEHRPALHTALRQADDTPVHVGGVDVMPEVRHTQDRMRAIAGRIRAGQRLGASGRAIDRVVNIGIGGSDLGPLLVCDALAGLQVPAEIAVDFVSNVDPTHLARALAGADPATTLFVVTSKTFTTAETMRNASSARAWLAGALGDTPALSSHFIAVSSNVPAARAFGVADDDILPLWDWVGGRYSLWSAVGLVIAIRCGWETYAALLAGAASLDTHFRTAPLEKNLPVLLALVDFWNARYLGRNQRIVVPYAQALARLPAFLQQLVLESNGKSVTRDGLPLDGPSSPALWGEPGTNSQHAFFQWLHQGTHVVPVEFVAAVRAADPLADHQAMLLANVLAQAQALMQGRLPDAIAAELKAKGVASDEIAAQVPHRACPGNRPSTMILLPALDGWRLGQLLALYEQRTFVEAVLMGINPFDQWGVELGKALAGPLLDALRGDDSASTAVDASTRGLLEYVRAHMDGTRR